MHSRRGLFWQSLALTLLLLLPMIATVLFLSAQRQQQQALRRAAAAEGGVSIATGAQNTHRLLLAVQGEQPAFVLLRLDGPAQSVTFCALPGQMLVAAPAGTTTLADCYLTAGPARAAQLLQGTAGPAPDAYFAATADTYAALLGGDTAVRFDTAAVFDKAARQALGCGKDSVLELTAATAGEFLTRAAGQSRDGGAAARSAVWAAFWRQNPSLLPGLPAAARENSARTLTNLRAQDYTKLEETLRYLAVQPELRVDYLTLSGVAAEDGWQADAAALARVQELLG